MISYCKGTYLFVYLFFYLFIYLMLRVSHFGRIKSILIACLFKVKHQEITSLNEEKQHQQQQREHDSVMNQL